MINKIQLIFRIILAPILFIFLVGAMALFPGTLMLIMMPVVIVLKLVGINISESYKDLLCMTFAIILYPLHVTKTFVLEARFPEGF